MEGEPIVKRTLGKRWPIFGEKEEKAHSGGLVQRGNGIAGIRLMKWGKRSQLTKTQSTGSLANGTVALQCALKAAGVKAGDEVIVPALTFVATATAAVLVNAVPVMVDVDPLTYNISPEAIEAAITPRTRAIIPVHNGGYPADMDAIMEIADRHSLWVIEDCAHAHGSQWRGKGVGSIGHLGTFSFQIGKTLTCGEGGMVLTNDETLAEKRRSFRESQYAYDESSSCATAMPARTVRCTG